MSSILSTRAIPRDHGFDSTLALLSEGYGFIPNRCKRFGTDIFETRLMLRRAVCVSGEEAARMFYQPGRFMRRNSLPPTTLMLLQDFGGVQLQEGGEHRRRKQMFMSLLDADSVPRLADISALHWRARFADWERRERTVLHDEAEAALCRAVCQWAGITLPEPEAARRTREFSAMIDGAGSVGPRNWMGMLLRSRTEQWARRLIEDVRARRLSCPQHSALRAIAEYRDAQGRALDTRAAAVELIALLRPTVAAARFITFAALALHAYPQCLQALHAGDDAALECFAQEVRRFYPFFPAVGGRAIEAFDWNGMHFARGAWVLLDIYGTNHDARIWGDPGNFRPERFRDWNRSPFNFIPQGGGDLARTHRCPGERLTIELLKTAVRLLTSEVRYDVPPQRLRIALSRMPAIPASRFVISGVRRIAYN